MYFLYLIKNSVLRKIMRPAENRQATPVEAVMCIKNYCKEKMPINKADSAETLSDLNVFATDYY